MAESKDSKLSRRDFIKGAGLVAASVATGAILGPKLFKKVRGASSEATYSFGHDFLNDPVLWVGKSGEKMADHMTEEVFNLLRDVNLPQDFDAEKVHDLTDKLFANVRTRGLDIAVATAAGLPLVVEPLETRYYEIASYADMLLKVSKRKEDIGKEKIMEEINIQKVEEKLTQLKDFPLDEAIERKKMMAVWNYNWDWLLRGDPLLNPVASSLYTGNFLNFTPYLFRGDVFAGGEALKPPVSRSPLPQSGDRDSSNRPEQTQVVNFDEKVAQKIRQELEDLGIDRAVNKISLSHLRPKPSILADADRSTGETRYFSDSGDSMGPEKYEKFERSILHNIVHEVFHIISSRRNYLSTSDRLKVRDLELSIIALADPLQSMERMFGDNGRDNGTFEDNAFSVTRYYLESVCNLYGDMESSAGNYLGELDAMMEVMAGEAVIAPIWKDAFNEDIRDYFDRLEKDHKSYRGPAKFLASLILENKELIVKSELNYYDTNDIAIPLVFAHAMLYKKDDLFSACLEAVKEENREYIINYLGTTRKRFETLVRVWPSEEFLAELFAEALLTKKYGKHSAGFVNEVLPKFQELIEIMKRNGLAAEFARYVV